MPEEVSTAVRPRFHLDLNRAEAEHVLRALCRAAAYAVRAALPDEREKARADADAYDELRDRLLDQVVAHDLRSGVLDEDDDT